MNRQKLYSRAFTIAEILIVLGIVGIVAEITIPSVVKDFQEAVIRTAFLKQVSVLSQITESYLADNGGTFMGEFVNRPAVITKFLQPYLLTTKVCADSVDTTCIHHSSLSLTSLPVNTSTLSLSNWSTSVITNDGVYIHVGNAFNDCTIWGSACVAGEIDINGDKGANRTGYDTFNWTLLPNKIIFSHPAYSSTDDVNTKCIKQPASGWNGWTNKGYGCGMRIIEGMSKWSAQ